MKYLLLNIVNKLKVLHNKHLWRKHNKHNYTTNENGFKISNVVVGKMTYGPLNVFVYNKDAHLSIGNYCSIAEKVNFLLGGVHDYGRISTYPFQSKVYRIRSSCQKNNDIVIEDDVWIGFGVLVLAGVKIGKGSVIGANSVVTKDVPPYSVYVGNKVIKQRFDENIINIIKGIDFSKVDHCIGDDYEKFVQTSINEQNVQTVFRTFLS